MRRVVELLSQILNIILMNSTSVAIAFLTFRPDRRQGQFYERFAELGYTVFVLVDDNDFVIPSSSLVRYLKINEQKCLAQGYVLLNPMISMRKTIPVSAWEKALFFFGSIHREFNHVWFFEDNVFIPDANLIARIDHKHPNADLLCHSNGVNHFGELKSWDWWKWVPREILPLPWAASMACAIRMSKNLLILVDKTITSNSDKMAKLHLLSKQKRSSWKFLFIEFLFNTLALQHRLVVELPTELSTVLFHKRWFLSELDNEHIYHPLKNIGEYDDWRSLLIGSRRHIN
jgi:hypothetical protein